MRERLYFDCEGARLAATLDCGAAQTGLLIVSGGNEIRIGAHRGMARIASDIATTGHPVFRFDRRGIGDSEGNNGEFLSSGPDIAAAVTAFRAHCPQLTRIIAFGNCDAASALLLHQPDVDGLVLTNIWVIEQQSDLPPPAAIKARYIEKLKNPREWVRLFTGAVNLKKLAGGLLSVAKPAATSSLAEKVASGLTSLKGPISILLASKDNTAIAFADAWTGAAFKAARARSDIKLTTIDSASHSFASETDYEVLKDAILAALADD